MAMALERVTGADQPTPRGTRRRRGSTLSDRQVAYAVKDGKQVTAFLSNGMTVTGWVFGSDDYHWSIADDEGRVYLVHKTTPAVEIHPEATIENAPEHIQQLVTPYRNAILRDHFKNNTSRQK